MQLCQDQNLYLSNHWSKLPFCLIMYLYLSAFKLYLLIIKVQDTFRPTCNFFVQLKYLVSNDNELQVEVIISRSLLKALQHVRVENFNLSRNTLLHRFLIYPKNFNQLFRFLFTGTLSFFKYFKIKELITICKPNQWILVFDFKELLSLLVQLQYFLHSSLDHYSLVKIQESYTKNPQYSKRPASLIKR